MESAKEDAIYSSLVWKELFLEWKYIEWEVDRTDDKCTRIYRNKCGKSIIPLYSSYKSDFIELPTYFVVFSPWKFHPPWPEKYSYTALTVTFQSRTLEKFHERDHWEILPEHLHYARAHLPPFVKRDIRQRSGICRGGEAHPACPLPRFYKFGL